MLQDMPNQTNTIIDRLYEDMSDKLKEKTVLEAQLLEAGYSIKDNPQLIAKHTQIESIRKQIIRETRKLLDKEISHVDPLGNYERLINRILELETTQQALKAKAEIQNEILDRLMGRMRTLPEKNRQLVELERKARLNDNLYIKLWENYEDVRIQEAAQQGLIHVIDTANPPAGVVSPKTARNVFLGAFFGLMLGVGLAYSREFFEGSIRGEEEIRKLGMQVIGRIPALKKEHIITTYSKRKNDWSILRAKNIFPYLLTQRSTYSTLAESYRVLRTAINFTNPEQKSMVILMTSAGPSEGKSTTAANLAITMARKGLNTLLVDGDLRRPVLDILLLGSHRKVGLTSVLNNERLWKNAVRETEIEGLHIIPAGATVMNAPELLSSHEMADFIQETRKVYDVVILDSPPLVPVTDAAVLSALMDGIILVIRVGKTSVDGLKRSLELLKPVGKRILGVVLTGIEKSSYYGYRNYYSTYADIEENGKKEKALVK